MKNKLEVSLITGVVIIYFILEMTLFDSRTVFMLLSPNSGISFGNAMHFFLFAVLRLLIYLVLPLYIILRITSEIIKRKSKEITNEETGHTEGSEGLAD